ncbi:hypothetical protein [Pontibacter amylolyticus]|uniref:Lipoprotein n=1 Tax=Pontibacter amylolyticus TaxID=1424080 RepID=A0ABQ1W5L4_9BACT|nr:hypothetical protein [Pontibacter amylolyticus]GGG14920.1 hypothetical protein GCM10011323_19180 [Pontibacter amylolyticus]
MKKILYTGFGILFGTMALVACDNTDRTGTTESDTERVVDRDSVATEYEVTETVVDYDTTKNTKKVDVDRDKERDNN